MPSTTSSTEYACKAKRCEGGDAADQRPLTTNNQIVLERYAVISRGVFPRQPERNSVHFNGMGVSGQVDETGNFTGVIAEMPLPAFSECLTIRSERR
jgi:hypothetical protein